MQVLKVFLLMCAVGAAQTVFAQDKALEAKCAAECVSFVKVCHDGCTKAAGASAGKHCKKACEDQSKACEKRCIQHALEDEEGGSDDEGDAHSDEE